jgi:hypothetical protein
MVGDYAPLPYVVFDAQGEAWEPRRPWEVWKVCLHDAHVAPVGWDAEGRPAVPGCSYAVFCECKRTSVGALEQLEGRHRSAADAHVALDLLLAEWNDPDERVHRAVIDRLILRRRARELEAFQARLRLAGQSPSPTRPAAVSVQLSLIDEGDVPF